MHSPSFSSHPGVLSEYDFSPAPKIALISTLSHQCFNCLGMMNCAIVHNQIIAFNFRVFVHHILNALKETRKVMLLVRFVKLLNVVFKLFHSLAMKAVVSNDNLHNPGAAHCSQDSMRRCLV